MSHFKSGIAVRCHCECHCRLIVGCFRLFACQVVYWFGCLVQLWAAQVGARPGRATSGTSGTSASSASAAAACVHFHSSAATHPSTVCQPKSLPGTNTTAADLLPPLLTQSSSPPFTAHPGLQRGLQRVPRPLPRPHRTDRPALSSPCAPRYGLRLPGCNLVTARPAGWKVGLGSGSSAGCLWKPQGR